MSVDLIIRAASEFACWQWLDARDLGTLTQDQTSGVWSYRHDGSQSRFIAWRDTGVMQGKTGWWAMLGFPGEPPESVMTWGLTFGADGIVEGFGAVSGDGISVIRPDQVQAYLVGIGQPTHGWFGGQQWSDAAIWALGGPAMEGETRTFDGSDYVSLIDGNFWNPVDFPSGWQIVDSGGTEWAVGTAYAVGDEVTYEGASYRCIQAHTSIVGWQPPNVPALWVPL
jgi:hypothetical protein